MGYSWALLDSSGSALGVFWVSLEVLFASFSSSGEGLEAKTSKCLKMMTLSMNLLYFRGAKASRMRSKSTPKREKVSNGERLQNEAPRLPKPPQKTFWTPKSPLRALQTGFGRLLGLSRGAPERSWAALGHLLGCLGGSCSPFGGDF